MRLRACCAAGVAAGLGQTAHAQESITYTLTWSEVVAGSNVPVPMPNGMIEPGEGVRIAIRATITPGIGSTATYFPPPPPGVGTIAGLGSMNIDLLGTNVNGGTWSNITRNAAQNPGGIPGGGNWMLGSGGSGQANGDIISLQAGQFILPGMTASATNPVENIWRGTWTPGNYAQRVASFQSDDSGRGYSTASILIQYGIDPNGHPQYVGKFVLPVLGNTGPIPIVPGPGGLVLLAMSTVTTVQGRKRTSRNRKGRP
ncbi:MAG: hypothetical protein ACKVW3_12810 [Phycisphaerales bacterium]